MCLHKILDSQAIHVADFTARQTSHAKIPKTDFAASNEKHWSAEPLAQAIYDECFMFIIIDLCHTR